jgi:photosystem II stability/assembly factor-like uncharacterized protein
MFIQEVTALSRLRRSRILTILPATLTFLALTLAPAALAQPRSRWAPFGPGGGTPRGLAVDSRNPSVVYAAADTLYRSADGGETWTALFGQGLGTVALDPANPSMIYAGGSQLARSTDGGRTWQTTSPPGISLGVAFLAVIPGNPSVVLAGTDSRLLRSTDGGATWSATFVAISPITALVADPGAPGTAYYADGSGLYKSTDAGQSWSLTGPSAGGQPLTYGRLALARGVLYLRAGSGIFRSDDGGRSWRQTGSAPAGLSLDRAFLADPLSPSKLYLAGLDGVYGSADDGATWRQLARGLPPLPLGETLDIESLAADPSRPGFLYAGTYERGVARSPNGGERWRIGVEPGLNEGPVARFKIHQGRPDTYYVGLATRGDRSFRSTDGGRTWQPFAHEIAREGLFDLGFDPVNPDRLYAANEEGLWESRDGGEAWDRIDTASTGRIAVPAPGTLLSGRICGLSRSTDDGRTWKRVVPCDLPGSDVGVGTAEIWIDPRNPRNVYALMQGSNGGSGFASFLVRSADGGATWKTLKGFPSLVAVAPSDFRTLYMVDLRNSQILRSRDSGTTWQVVQARSPYPDFYDSLAVDATDPDTLYVGSSQKGVLRSEDGGVTLRRVGGPFGTSKRSTRLLATGRNHPGVVWAAPLNGGLFWGRFE